MIAIRRINGIEYPKAFITSSGRPAAIAATTPPYICCVLKLPSHILNRLVRLTSVQRHVGSFVNIIDRHVIVFKMLRARYHRRISTWRQLGVIIQLLPTGERIAIICEKEQPSNSFQLDPANPLSSNQGRKLIDWGRRLCKDILFYCVCDWAKLNFIFFFHHGIFVSLGVK